MGVSEWAVNAFSMSFMISYICTFWVGRYVLNRGLNGLRVATLLACTLTAIGSGLKLIDPTAFGWSFFGQSIIAFGQCFFIAAPPVLSANWFGENERGLAIGLALLFNSSGVAFGFLVPPLLVTKGDEFWRLWVLQTVMSCIALAGAVFDFPAHPPTPPSLAAQRRLESAATNAGTAGHAAAAGETTTTGADTGSSSGESLSTIASQLRMVLRNRQFVLLIVVVATSSGLFWAISTVLGQLMAGGFTTTEVGVTGTVATFLGIASQLLFGWLLDRTKWYRGLTVVGLACTGASLMLLNVGLSGSGSYALVLIAISSTSTFLSGVIPVCFELGVEQTYPMTEADSGSILMLSANVCGLIFTAIFASSTPDVMRILLWVFGSLIAALALVFTFAFKPELRRPKQHTQRQHLLAHSDSNGNVAGMTNGIDTQSAPTASIEVDGLFGARSPKAGVDHGSTHDTTAISTTTTATSA